MACASCNQARAAAGAAVKAITTGRIAVAKTQAGIAMQAVSDKAAETLRLRGLLRR